MLISQHHSPLAAALLLASGLAQAASFTQTGAGLLATDVSADGRVVVGSNAVSGHYFTWTADAGLVDIGGKAATSGVGGSPRISADASRVSGVALNAANNSYEMAYRNMSTGQWTTLGGIGGSNGTTTVEVSADGKTFVGFGNVNGSPASVGFIVNIAQAVPEPSSYALLGSGLLAMAWLRRRQLFSLNTATACTNSCAC